MFLYGLLVYPIDCSEIIKNNFQDGFQVDWETTEEQVNCKLQDIVISHF